MQAAHLSGVPSSTTGKGQNTVLTVVKLTERLLTSIRPSRQPFSRFLTGGVQCSGGGQCKMTNNYAHAHVYSTSHSMLRMRCMFASRLPRVWREELRW